MNKITLQYPSASLGTTATVIVLLPKTMPPVFTEEKAEGAAKKIYPVMYLLHGAFDSAECWLWKADLASLVDEKGFAAVLCSVGNSFYIDLPDGGKYFTFLTEELPQYLSEILPISEKRSETFIGGISMGGYGAFRAALLKPEKYAGAFAMSGAVDISLALRFVSHCGGTLPSPLQKPRELRGGSYDLEALLEGTNADTLPEFSVACGENDYFFASNKAFFERLVSHGAKASFTSSPGDHEWCYWRKQLPKSVSHMLGKEAIE